MMLHDLETGMRLDLAAGALLLLVCPAPVSAQDGAPAGSSVPFPQVTATPIPLQSVSGRFSSLNPVDRRDCGYKRVSGQLVSPRLVLVRDIACGRRGHDNLLVNVQLSNPADLVQMVAGRRVTITARFKIAEEDRDPVFVAAFVIAEKATIATDPRDPSERPAPVFTSYMLCQPPELDALAGQLGKDLCVQNSLIADLAAMGPALEAAARAPAKLLPQDPGLGDPTAITCRYDPGVSDRHLSALACARNNYWAWYAAKWHDPRFTALAPP
jgi:hypothetical protein